MVVKLPLRVAQEAVERPGGVYVLADDLAMVVDVGGPAWTRRRGHRSVVNSPRVQQKATDRSRLACPGWLAVVADDLPSIVDLDGAGARGAGDIDRGETAALSRRKPQKFPARRIVVAAHDLAAVVDADERGLRHDVRVIDGGELAALGPAGSRGLMRS